MNSFIAEITHTHSQPGASIKFNNNIVHPFAEWRSTWVWLTQRIKKPENVFRCEGCAQVVAVSVNDVKLSAKLRLIRTITLDDLQTSDINRKCRESFFSGGNITCGILLRLKKVLIRKAFKTKLKSQGWSPTLPNFSQFIISCFYYCFVRKVNHETYFNHRRHHSTMMTHPVRLSFTGHLGLHIVPQKAGIVIKNWTMDQQSFEPGGSH